MVIGDLLYWLYFTDLNQIYFCHWGWYLISVSSFIQFRRRKGFRKHIFNNTEMTEDKMGKLQIRAEYILNSDVPRRCPGCWDPTLCAGRLLARSLIQFCHVPTSELWKQVPAMVWQSDVPESACKWGDVVFSASVPVRFCNISCMLSHWKLFNLFFHPWCI